LYGAIALNKNDATEYGYLISVGQIVFYCGLLRCIVTAIFSEIGGNFFVRLLFCFQNKISIVRNLSTHS